MREEHQVLFQPFVVEAQDRYCAARAHVCRALRSPDETNFAENVARPECGDKSLAAGLPPHHVELSAHHEVHAAADGALLDQPLSGGVLAQFRDQDRLADLVAGHALEQRAVLERRTLLGHGEDFVEPDQADARHDQRRDQQVGEDGEQHRRRGERAELRDQGEVGKQQHPETQREGEADRDHRRRFVLHGFDHRLVVVGRAAAQFAVARKQVDGAVDRNADRDYRNHHRAGIQGNFEDPHDPEDHEDRHHARYQRDESALGRSEHQRHDDEHHPKQRAERNRLAFEQAVGGGVDHEVLPHHRRGHVRTGEMPNDLAQLADVVVERGRIAHVVAHHDIGAPVIVADIGLEIPRRVEQQVLRDQLAGRRYSIGLGPPASGLLVGLRHHVGQRKTAIEDLLLGDEGLDVGKPLQVGRIAECALGIGLQRDVEDLDAREILLHAQRILHERPLRPEEGQRFVGDVKTRSLLDEHDAQDGGQRERPEGEAVAHHAEGASRHGGKPARGGKGRQPALAWPERGIEHREEQDRDQPVGKDGKRRRQAEIPDDRDARERVARKTDRGSEHRENRRRADASKHEFRGPCAVRHLALVRGLLQAGVVARDHAHDFGSPDHDHQRGQHGRKDADRDARPAHHPEGPQQAYGCDHKGHGSCEQAAVKPEHRKRQQQRGGRHEHTQVVNEALADLGIDARRAHLSERGELRSRGHEYPLERFVDFLFARAFGAFPDRNPDRDGIAVGTDDIARGERVFEGLAVRALRALRVRRRGSQQRTRGQLPFDAAHGTQGEQVVQTLDERQLPELVVKVLERLQLRGGPELGIPHINEASMIRPEFARNAQVRLPVGVVLCDQALEPGVHGHARYAEEGQQADTHDERQAGHRPLRADTEETLEEAARFGRSDLGFDHRSPARVPARSPSRSPSNTASGT